MAEPLPPFTIKEAAARLRLSEYTVGQMTRDGRLPRLLGVRRTRIPAWAVFAMMEGRYDAGDAQSNRTPPAKAPTSWGRKRRQADGSLEKAPMGSGDPLHRPIGPAPGDVVVRVVEGRSR